MLIVSRDRGGVDSRNPGETRFGLSLLFRLTRIYDVVQEIVAR